MALFSQRMRDEAQAAFQARLPRTGSLGRRVQARLEALDPDTAAAVRWLYGASPLSDWFNYGFDLFLAHGTHGAALRRSGFARDVPEDVFLNYVLHCRVNEEELCVCRETFHGLLAPPLAGLTPRQAVIEANYWCMSQVTYRAADARTRSALAVWRSGWGRCGEESTFTVNVLRAVGVPARQIYTPRWAHCDDNHAWVEVWVDGDWHFLGACEPEEVLDRGWFTSAASRAMVIHSRRFGPGDGGEEVIGRDGAVTLLNQLPRYAETKALTVRVSLPGGGPAEDAEVIFGVLNMSEFYPAATVRTGPDGAARLRCGLGSVCVRVRKEGMACERMVFVPETDTVEIVLQQETPLPDVWEEFAVAAPRDRPSPAPKPTEAQKALGREKAAAAAAKRAGRQLPPPGECAFIADSRFPREKKAALLAVLSEKDRLDAAPAVLAEALEFPQGGGEGGELFWRYAACPRIADEPLRLCRRDILEYFPAEQLRDFRALPFRIWDFIRERAVSAPALEYDRLVTLPAAALRRCCAGRLSQRILFVAICRAAGVPARLNPAGGEPEYWAEGGFHAVDALPENASIVLENPSGEKWQYWADFAVGVLEEGAYRTLKLSHIGWEKDRLTFPARPGEYRIITSSRLPNGDIFAGKIHFRLEAGETKSLRLRKYQAELSRMLGDYTLEDYAVSSIDGQPIQLSALTEGRTVLLWLEEGAEPTEHLLNELLERREDFRKLPAKLVFLLRGQSSLENGRLRQALDAFPEARVCFDSFVPNVETVARRVYVDHEKLPLVVVTAKPLNAVYASSGYNVGSGDMLLRICGIA